MEMSFEQACSIWLEIAGDPWLLVKEHGQALGDLV